jgi:hypothetical protein
MIIEHIARAMIIQKRIRNTLERKPFHSCMAAISLAHHLSAGSSNAANLQLSGKTSAEVRTLFSLVDTFLVSVEASTVHYMHAATAIGILGADHGLLDIRTIGTHPVAATA